MVTRVMATPSLPPHWFYCDAPYFGGAETYLQWHLEAAAPEQLGLIAVARPTLAPWLQQLEERGRAPVDDTSVVPNGGNSIENSGPCGRGWCTSTSRIPTTGSSDWPR